MNLPVWRLNIENRLVKFIWLDGSESDHKKFFSLGRNEIWFVQKDYLNDPYEYKGMLLDRNKLLNAGYSNDIIDYYQQLFDFSDYGITCLSANSIDYLPMWAYYTNKIQKCRKSVALLFIHSERSYLKLTYSAILRKFNGESKK